MDIHADSISKLLVAQFHLFFRMFHLLLFLSDVSKKRKHIFAPPFITILQRTIVKNQLFPFWKQLTPPRSPPIFEREDMHYRKTEKTPELVKTFTIFL
nr:MAG: hypothetical protein [Bacteriophage sp.]